MEVEITERLLEASRTMHDSDPAVDRSRPLKVALFGSVGGQTWRSAFTRSYFGERPIEWFDPIPGFTAGSDEHYVGEILHMHDDIRVAAAMPDSPSLNTLLEIGHILEERLVGYGPLVAYVAPTVNDDVMSETDRAQSNYWRTAIIEHLGQYQGQPNLFVASSPEELLEITGALIADLQPL